MCECVISTHLSVIETGACNWLVACECSVECDGVPHLIYGTPLWLYVCIVFYSSSSCVYSVFAKGEHIRIRVRSNDGFLQL